MISTISATALAVALAAPGGWAFEGAAAAAPIELRLHDRNGNAVELRWPTQSAWGWRKSEAHPEAPAPALTVWAEPPAGVEVLSVPADPKGPFPRSIRLELVSPLHTRPVQVRSGRKKPNEHGLAIRIKPRQPAVLVHPSCRKLGVRLAPGESARSQAQILFLGASCRAVPEEEAVDVYVHISDDGKWAQDSEVIEGGSPAPERIRARGESWLQLRFDEPASLEVGIQEQLGPTMVRYQLSYDGAPDEEEAKEPEAPAPKRDPRGLTPARLRVGPSLGLLDLGSTTYFVAGARLESRWTYLEQPLDLELQASFKGFTGAYQAFADAWLRYRPKVGMGSFQPLFGWGVGFFSMDPFEGPQRFGPALGPELQLGGVYTVDARHALVAGFKWIPWAQPLREIGRNSVNSWTASLRLSGFKVSPSRTAAAGIEYGQASYGAGFFSAVFLLAL